MRREGREETDSSRLSSESQVDTGLSSIFLVSDDGLVYRRNLG